jgi:lipopolysaccharide export system protein LptC
MEADRYSRLVSWLKILFPLIALVLLSTLFLLSRAIDPEATIPFADTEVQERLRDQQVTGPFYSGTTDDGDLISFSAEKLTTPRGQTGTNEAEDLRAVLDLQSGAQIVMDAARAKVDAGVDQAELIGNVRIKTSTGYSIQSERMTSNLTTLDIASPGPVEANSPAGEITAGAMAITNRQDGAGSQMLFTKGVKLIYTPQSMKE